MDWTIDWHDSSHLGVEGQMLAGACFGFAAAATFGDFWSERRTQQRYAGWFKSSLQAKPVIPAFRPDERYPMVLRLPGSQ
ncbi:MAG: hypothetical protein R3F53_05230 [Gammaproteobacteria bacterium]